MVWSEPLSQNDGVVMDSVRTVRDTDGPTGTYRRVVAVRRGRPEVLELVEQAMPGPALWGKRGSRRWPPASGSPTC